MEPCLPRAECSVQVVKCKDLDEADAKAKEVLEAFFEDKVNIKVRYISPILGL